MKKVQVSIGGKSVELSLDQGTLLSLHQEPVPYQFTKVGDREWLLNVNGKVFTVSDLGSAIQSDRESSGGVTVRIRLNDRYYEATVDDERSLLMKSLSRTQAAGGGTMQIRAPMPGLISRLEVRKGDKVKAGQGLLILEAMKMENEIRSPEHGIIQEVAAVTGVAVEKGEVLVTLQPD